MHRHIDQQKNAKQTSINDLCYNVCHQGRILSEFEPSNFQQLKLKMLLKLACTPLWHWELIAIVLVCLASPFIHCHWYFVTVNGGGVSEMLFCIGFHLKLQTVQLWSSRTLDCPTYEYTPLSVID